MLISDRVVYHFQTHTIALGFDEDGDPITSLVVEMRTPVSDRDEGGHPFAVNDAEITAQDDTFIDKWIRELVTSGKRPSGRYLEAHKATVASLRKMTQIRIREAIIRLKGDGRLIDEPNGPGGQKWLRPVDQP